MNPLTTRPPDGKYPECSADVILVYADGREVPGYWCSWSGYMRTDDWIPMECDHDDVMPVGWKEVQS